MHYANEDPVLLLLFSFLLPSVGFSVFGFAALALLVLIIDVISNLREAMRTANAVLAAASATIGVGFGNRGARLRIALVLLATAEGVCRGIKFRELVHKLLKGSGL